MFFRPDSCDHFSRLAYCDVVGREARLPLKLKGEGMGPKCLFSFDTLDIQSVFVNSSHAYEVILRNTGSIDATFSLVPPTSMFGPKFTFAPSSGTLAPDSLQAIQVRHTLLRESICLFYFCLASEHLSSVRWKSDICDSTWEKGP